MQPRWIQNQNDANLEMIFVVSKHSQSKRLNWKQIYLKLSLQITASYALSLMNPIMTKNGP